MGMSAGNEAPACPGANAYGPLSFNPVLQQLERIGANYFVGGVCLYAAAHLLTCPCIVRNAGAFFFGNRFDHSLSMSFASGLMFSGKPFSKNLISQRARITSSSAGDFLPFRLSRVSPWWAADLHNASTSAAGIVHLYSSGWWPPNTPARRRSEACQSSPSLSRTIS